MKEPITCPCPECATPRTILAFSPSHREKALARRCRACRLKGRKGITGRRGLAADNTQPTSPEPTRIPPGPWRVAVYEARAEAKQAIFHPEDVRA